MLSKGLIIYVVTVVCFGFSLPATATSFEEYASWTDWEKSQFEGKLLAHIEMQALNKGDDDFATCISESYRVGTNEMIEYKAALKANAEQKTTNMTAEEVGAGMIFKTCLK